MDPEQCLGFSIHEQKYTMMVSAVALISMYFFVRTFTTTPRQRAWIISLFSSSVLTLIGIYMATKIMLLKPGVPVWSLIWSDTGVVRIANGYFAVAMILDIVLGLMDYPKHLPILTCWIHHTFYLWLVYFTLQNCLTGSVGILYLLEFPTFILALGSVFPKMRSDLGFGGSFFILRLVYHSWVCFHGYLGLFSVPARGYIFLFGAVVGILHVYWFGQWATGQMRRSSKKKSTTEIGNNILDKGCLEASEKKVV